MLTISAADAFRLGLTPDLSVDQLDPRNARYLVPLDNDADEETAHTMADAIVTMGCDGDEAFFEQALIDSHRMLLDPAYEALFTEHPEGREWLEEAMRRLQDLAAADE
jgi:hypothetical protein